MATNIDVIAICYMGSKVWQLTANVKLRACQLGIDLLVSSIVLMQDKSNKHFQGDLSRRRCQGLKRSEAHGRRKLVLTRLLGCV